MKNIKDMTDEELKAEYAKIDTDPKAPLKDPSEMTDEELAQEAKYYNGDSPWEGDVGRFASEVIMPTLDTVTKPIQWAANALDYPVSAVRGGLIQGIKEAKADDSSTGSVMSAVGRGGLKALARNPFEYDPESNYAQLERELGVTDKPIGEFTKPIEGMVPDFIERIPVNQATGMATEMVADPFTVASEVSKGVGGLAGGTLAERAVKNTEKALVRISDASPKDTSEWLNKQKLDSVARTAQEEGLIKYITNPKKLKEKLEGITVNKEGVQYPGKRSPVKLTKGLLDKVGGELDSSIEKMDKGFGQNGFAVNKKVIADTIAQKLNDADEAFSSGTPYDGAMPMRTKDIVDGILKVGMGKPEVGIRDLVELKRAAQEYLYDLNKSPALDVQGTKNLKNIYQSVENSVDGLLNQIAISNMADKQAGLDFLKLNQKYSDLSTLRRIVKDSNYNAMKELIPSDMLPGMIVSGAGAGAAGMNPMVAAGGYGVARGIVSSMGDTAPAYTARVQNALDTGLPGVSGQYFNKGQKPAVMMRGLEGNPGREPQSLPMSLVSYQIPRNSKAILENKDVIVAKIAQMSNDPHMVEMFQDALINHPEKLSKALPALVLGFPDLFEDDDYNRVDGKIFDPRLKQKALLDLRNSKTMTLREKAFKAKRLQQEGVLE